jgi:hypothetical protein
MEGMDTKVATRIKITLWYCTAVNNARKPSSGRVERKKTGDDIDKGVVAEEIPFLSKCA